MTDESTRNGGSIDKDGAFTILSNQRRRWIIQALNTHGEMDRSELATKVAAKENNKPANQLTSKERNRVLVALHQSHLPKMADYGVIDYEDARVSPTKAVPVLMWYVEAKPEKQSDWLSLLPLPSQITGDPTP